MRFRKLLILGFLCIAASFWVHIENLYKIAQRRHAVKKARTFSASVKKPILNYGCFNTSYGHVNADIEKQPVPNFMLIEPSPSPLPFPSKYFGAAICTHVKEHVPDPDALEAELSRVADRVYVAVPSPAFLWTWVWPEHRWVFLRGRTIRLH
ncbi:MAG: methyltransferase domain-containing protein [Candidatus Bathyarchaeota archaeon]|jgi:hypothetical protein|nr:methyltransferase domain-containing protein [Candidatus Bathyarchaeota archaeon]